MHCTSGKNDIFLSHFDRLAALNSRSVSLWRLGVLTDAELVNAVLDGKKQAFARLVERYERPVRAVAMDILGDGATAQDVAQDAFVKAYANLRALRKPAAFGSWLMKITRRCALATGGQSPGEKALDCAKDIATESTDGRLDEQKQSLLSAVLRLPESEKQVVMLRYFADCSVRDVAEMLGRSVGTVTKQLSRAHNRLRNILERSEK
jgi:RNA polymerase sigma factor (sigma-70 family)